VHIENSRKKKRSIVNTVITIILTIVVLTALYGRLWHRGLNDVVIRQQVDSVVGECHIPLITADEKECAKISSNSLFPTARSWTCQDPRWRVQVLIWPERRSRYSVQQLDNCRSNGHNVLRLWRQLAYPGKTNSGGEQDGVAGEKHVILSNGTWSNYNIQGRRTHHGDSIVVQL
jgi:hypothetical protein